MHNLQKQKKKLRSHQPKWFRGKKEFDERFKALHDKKLLNKVEFFCFLSVFVCCHFHLLRTKGVETSSMTLSLRLYSNSLFSFFLKTNKNIDNIQNNKDPQKSFESAWCRLLCLTTDNIVYSLRVIGAYNSSEHDLLTTFFFCALEKSPTHDSERTNYFRSFITFLFSFTSNKMLADKHESSIHHFQQLEFAFET
jgi:hypothetical protein